MALTLKALLKADSREFVRGVDSAERSLEELANTSSRSNKRLITANDQAAQSFGKVKGAIVGMLAAFTTSQFASGVNSVIQANAELNLLEQSLNVNKDALYAWGRVGKQAGVDIADVFKDVSEKVADFATTGGGEAGDVFKRLKLDVQEMIALSPDQQILKIVEAMDKLDNISNGERIFIMESLANDASKLLPLLRDNAEKLREIDVIARASGALITEEQNKILSDAKQNLELIGIAMNGAGNAAGVAGAKIVNAFGPGLLNELTQLDDWINRQVINVEIMAGVWSDTWDSMGVDTSGATDFIGDVIDAMVSHARLTFTYLPVFLKASWDAAGLYTDEFVAHSKAAYNNIDAAFTRVMANVVEYAGTAFGKMPELAGQAVGLVIRRFAAMAGGVASALSVLDNVPGFDNVGGGAEGVEKRLLDMAASAEKAGAAVVSSAVASAAGMRLNATVSDGLADSYREQAKSAAESQAKVWEEAKATVANTEAKRDMEIAELEARNVAQLLGNSLDRNTKSSQKLYVNTEKVNEALNGKSKAAAKAKTEVDKLQEAQDRELAALRDTALALGNTEIGYYGASLAAQDFEKGVRKEAEAINYRNRLEAESQRIARDARSTLSQTAQLRESLTKDVGLSLTDAEALVSRDLLNRFNDLQAVVALGAQKASLSEQDYRALELRLVNGLTPAMADTIAKGEQLTRNKEEATRKAKELNAAQNDELKALRDTALQLGNTELGYYAASLAAKDFESDVRKEAEALDYRNRLEAESQRIARDARSTLSQTAQLRESLTKDVGLSLPDAEALVSRDLLNRFNDLQAVVALGAQKASLSEQEYRALELRLVNGLTPAMAETVAAGEQANRTKEEQIQKAEELQAAQDAELKALRDTALQLSTTEVGYYNASLAAKDFESGVRKEAEALNYRNRLEEERQRIANDARSSLSTTDQLRSTLSNDVGLNSNDVDDLVSDDLKNRMDAMAASTREVMLQAQLSTEAYREWTLVTKDGFTPAGAQAQIMLEKQAEQFTQSRALVDDLSTTINDSLTSSLQGMVDTGSDLLDTLINKFLEAALSAESLSGFFGSLGGSGSVGAGSGGGIGGAIGNAVGSLLGFAHGGSFEVGGSGGTDSQLVAFRASPNERVTIETPDQVNSRSQGGGGVSLNYAPVISVQSGADMAQVEAMVENQYQRYKSEVPSLISKELFRGGANSKAVGMRR